MKNIKIDNFDDSEFDIDWDKIYEENRKRFKSDEEYKKWLDEELEKDNKILEEIIKKSAE